MNQELKRLSSFLKDEKNYLKRAGQKLSGSKDRKNLAHFENCKFSREEYKLCIGNDNGGGDRESANTWNLTLFAVGFEDQAKV